MVLLARPGRERPLHVHIDETGRQVGSFDYRTIARSESEDFANFPAPEKVVEPDFSLASAYHHTSDTLDIQLAVSRDDVHFDCWLEPFVRLGVTGRFDSQSPELGTPSGPSLSNWPKSTSASAMISRAKRLYPLSSPGALAR